MPYREPPPELDQRFNELVAALANDPDDQGLKASAADLAYMIRSRCMDLATWKADFSPEYSKRIAQGSRLTSIAGDQADDVLQHDFGSAAPNQSSKRTR